MQTETPDLLWQPTPATFDGSGLAAYLDFLRAWEPDGFTAPGPEVTDPAPGEALPSYASLWRWSTADLPAFWASLWDFLGHAEGSGHRPSAPEEVLPDASMPGARWFPGAPVNFAERCLAGGEPDDLAVVCRDETGARTETTYAALSRQVAGLAATFRDLGVGPGDAVAGYLPNRLETLVAMLASASVGAVWTCAAPEFGTPSVLSRFEQLGPRVLVAVDGYRYGGADHDRRTEVAALAESLPTLTDVVEVPLLGLGLGNDLPAATLAWDEAVRGPDQHPAAKPAHVATEFSDPLWVLWSSGTTGRPKGIVQSHGGITLELGKALSLGCDVRRGDRYFVATSAGWMMWNFAVAGLLVGAEVVLYDGSPTHPDADGVWRVAAEEGAAVVGVGAAYLTAGMQRGREPSAYDLGALRSLLQTGSTLPEEAWRWIGRELPGVQLQSISGGTDVCSVLAGTSPLLPSVVGRISAPWLGVDLEAWDVDGRPVTGEEGELVVRSPMPSMPLGLLGDDDGSRYRAAYFDVFPGTWRHGDWVVVHDDLTLAVAGRSDATLNRGGVRIGSAELYDVLDDLEGLADSLVVGVDLADGEYWMPLFVVPDGDQVVDHDFADRLRTTLRTRLSPRHVPDEVIEVPRVPRTLTGKRLEVPVTRILADPEGSARIAGDQAGRGAVDHPEMLDWFAAYAVHRRDTRAAPPASG
ncbi:acetoacetate--CoA ligase [Nocardioidaceae bacterium]|nr:acetoacetate--CoA ligase [Nocardioidaceae bacterium]